MITKRTLEDAVSPVIGILLMLVVTIIIAAVVSGFASGLAGGQSKAPQASIEESTDLPTHNATFQHKGGDAVKIDSISVVFIQGDTKATLSATDAGTNICKGFKVLGKDSTTFSPGDRLVLSGTDFGWYTDKPGKDPSTIAFGSASFKKGDEWMIIDKKSSATICRGTIS
ncbi:type IV pilin N-terminal domain-containing protein [uncultured Methanospirillum sp.]|uniref:type IV pilin N-terminal domain-containing protein n=1 Tax=uncultured Methanospirillum sp. TaxID=262503 RepID=UPI0029C7E3EA|nr:type IV pilin N-terminal domain-containing protein [uncultured Methanospirillum sp.]